MTPQKSKQTDDFSDRWPKAILPVSSTVKEVCECLATVELQIVLIVDSNNFLVGTVNDGDVRRAMLGGLNLDSPIGGIIEKNPIVVSPEITRKAAFEIMLTHKIRQLPIVNENRQICGIHLWDRVAAPSKKRDNLMIIMAGGLGTRMRPHTEDCPKPLLPVAGKPMLQHIIERAKSNGFHNFVLAVHHLGHMIEDYFGNGEALLVQIDYVREQQPLGTVGALSLLRDRPSEAFVVTNGDVLTDINYGEILDFHYRHNAEATMAVRSHEWEHPFGVVQTSGVDIIGIQEKPVARSNINAGIYVLSPEVLSFVPAHERYDMPFLFELLRSMNKRCVAYPMHEPWLDVGRPDDYAAANLSYSNKKTNY
jgi:dTDP-glucose pyrophosphorylase